MSSNFDAGTGQQDPPFLLDRLALHASQTPDKVALTFLGNGPSGGTVERTMTYGELAKETDRIATTLLPSKGLKGGDMAVLVYPPSLDFMVAFLACLKAGVVAVPVFPPHPARRDTLFMFSRIVEGCGARFALTCKTYNHMKKLGNIKESLGRFKRPANAASWPDQLDWIVTDIPGKKTAAAAVAPGANTPPSRSDLAFLQYTSGSTSEPKGVMITHGNLAHNLTIITNELEATDETVVVSWLPQYHDMGLIGSYLGILYCGGCGYYLSPLSFLQRPMVWMEAVSKYRATHLQAPNFAFKLTAKKFDGASYGGGGGVAVADADADSLEFSSVRHIINAAEPVTAESIDSFMDAFCPFGLKKEVMFPTYGLAEHTVFVCSGGKQRLDVVKQDLEVDGVVTILEDTLADGSDEGKTTLIGCGYPARQAVDVRIVNTESMQEVGEDSVGEMWVRSPSKAAGYHNKEVETKADFFARLATTDGTKDGQATEEDSSVVGYLRTGDLGFLHNGELFICGRLKDLIIVGGRNYYPQDIEATAEAATDALRPGCSAAFSVDTVGATGEEVALVAELREVPNSKDTEDVCRPIAEKLKSAINREHSLGISHVVLLRPRTVPKTTSGKIARAWCRKAFVGKTLDVIYGRSFKADAIVNPLEIDDGKEPPRVLPANADEIRKMDKESIMQKLVDDVCRIGSMSPDLIDKGAALITMLDSLSISQFKGMLEVEYATKLSDEYLFREQTTLEKLVEVVKLGYAPDDSDGEGGMDNAGVHQQAVGAPSSGGGLAGALGCPPGVVCCVVM